MRIFQPKNFAMATAVVAVLLAMALNNKYPVECE